jgi:cupin superfamily acireductone dioxygenase involved in methionine salvage
MPGEERTYDDIKAGKYDNKVKDIDLTLTTNLKLLKDANERYKAYYQSYKELGASSGYKGKNVINFEKELADQEKYIEKLLKESFEKLDKKAAYKQEIVKAGGVKVKITGIPVEMKDYSAIFLVLEKLSSQ